MHGDSFGLISLFLIRYIKAFARASTSVLQLILGFSIFPFVFPSTPYITADTLSNGRFSKAIKKFSPNNFPNSATVNQENVIDDQGGEEVANGTTNGLQYLRTSWRVVIVKDTQSNSTDPQITWDQVFTSGVVKTNEEVGGINSELNIGNMGRFVILSDQYIELSAENPQKTVKFVIPGSKVGSVRYNGPSDTALTDKGVYVIAANQSTGLYTSATVAYPGLCAVQSRFCFVDD